MYTMIYVICKDSKEAESIGRTLVEKRLVACVNIIPEITSFFRWKGEVRKEGEALLLAKTRESLVEKITETVKELHSYSVPCITSFPITKGNREYLKWIDKETEG
jgi:periplasmic divalent cation tolerance protein